MRGIRAGLALVALAAALAAPSAALADVEPNDGITQVEGPLTGGTVYSGTLPNSGDRDWYVFYVTSQTQLDVSFTTPGDSPCGDSYVYLRSTDGVSIASTAVDPNETGHLKYTTPVGTTRFLLEVGGGCGAGGKYQFSLQPAASVVPGPSASAPVASGEPNENADQAFGPLTGDTSYAGKLETSNDQDWFFFFTSGTTPFDLALTNLNDGCPAMTLYRDDNRSSSIDSRSPDANGVGHILLTPTGPAKYLVKVTGCLGASYQLRVEPAAALAGALPVAPSGPVTTGITAACRSAKRSVTTWKARVKSTTRSLRRARRARAKRVLRARLKSQKRRLTRARDNVAIRC